MNNYETIFIIKPSLPDDEVEKTVEKIKGVIQKGGGELLKVENWGKKKLAYEVRKEKRGTYILLHFKGTGALVEELERNYRLDESVIKFITLKLEEKKKRFSTAAKTQTPGDAGGGIEKRREVF
jgi:small subunit ribosomal protein S6